MMAMMASSLVKSYCIQTYPNKTFLCPKIMLSCWFMAGHALGYLKPPTESTAKLQFFADPFGSPNWCGFC